MPFYVAGSVKANATVGVGTGFFVARGGAFAGRYKVSIPTTAAGKLVITTVTTFGASHIARIVSYVKTDTWHTIEIEIKLSTGGLIDGDFNFIALEVS
jgi:hypothetical protein